VAQPLQIGIVVRAATEKGHNVIQLFAQLRSAAFVAHDAQRPLGVQALALLLQLPSSQSFVGAFHAANYAPLCSAQACRAVCVTVMVYHRAACESRDSEFPKFPICFFFP
jgi:hypothetical protein